MKPTTIFLFVIYSIFMSAQTPVLVSDFRTGSADGYNAFNYRGMKLGEKYILPVITDELGEELGVVEEESVSLLLDINMGAGGSAPKDFIRFGGKIYFTAIDNENGGGIWVTDGTKQGTKKIFSPENAGNKRPKGLITNYFLDYIYFTFDNNLFRTNGEESEELMQNVSFEKDSKTQGRNYATYTYGDLAFLKESDDKVQVMAVIGDSIHLLGETDETSGFYSIHELCGTSGGLLFGLEDQFEEDKSAIYYYEFPHQGLKRWTLYGEEIVPSRMHVANDSFALIWERNRGYYLASGLEIQLEEVLQTDEGKSVQGRGLNYVVNNGNLLLFVDAGSFVNSKMYYHEIGLDRGQVILETNQHVSPIVDVDGTAYFATNISNGFVPELYAVDLAEGIVDTLYFFSEQSSIESVLPLTVLDSKLYFLSDLDDEVGRELYYIDLGQTTDIRQANLQNPLSVDFLGKMFRVDSNAPEPIEVSIFNAAGALLQSFETTSGVYHQAPASGVLIVYARQDDYTSSHKWIVTD